MAELKIDTVKIIENIRMINDYFEANNKTWSLVTKILSGHEGVLEKLIASPEILRVHSLADSRLSNLKAVKDINPDIMTMYIKPPAIPNAEDVIKYSDISLNTSLETIEALSNEAVRQNKNHRVIIMLEMGELREGVLRENIVGFYSDIFQLDNIEVIGLGTNLGCMYGIEPTYDKMIQLSLYKELLEAKFNKHMPFISGGSSITLPLIDTNRIPSNINHFRIGEAVFLGISPLEGKRFMNLHTDAFSYVGNIIEMEEKENVPDGNISEGNIGHTAGGEDSTIGERKDKAIVDFGLLDVDIQDVEPKANDINFVGTTSDMTVFEIADKEVAKLMEVGDTIEFVPNYMGIAKLMNSRYIDKEIS